MTNASPQQILTRFPNLNPDIFNSLGCVVQNETLDRSLEYDNAAKLS